MRVIPVLVAMAWWAAATAGEPVVDPLLSGALAVLRVNDPRVLDRETTQFAATLGIDPAPMRSAMGRLLFRARSLDGIDLARPALMAWRPGTAPLLAVIPLSDRRAFLESFGASFGDEAPLIRVGERDGTVVYSQNGNDGLIEYRLLVSDRSAYLARTLEECRQLASRPLQPALTDPALVFTASAAYLKDIHPDLALGLPAGREADLARLLPEAFKPVAERVWSELLTQVAGVVIEVRPENESMVKVTARIQAAPESLLAIWIGNQRNQPSRLQPLVRGPATVVAWSGNVAWQGQAERVGQILAEVLKPRHGAAWTAVVDETWHSIATIVDRCGPFAAAYDIEMLKGEPRSEWRYLAEQSRAQELVSFVNSFGFALTGVAGEQFVAGGLAGFRVHAQVAGVPVDTVDIANERFLLDVRSSLHDAATVAGALVTRTQAIGPPEGAAGVFQLGVNLTPGVRALAQIMGGAPQPVLPAADFAAVVKTGAPGQLVLETALPVQRVSQLIRDAALIQLGSGK
jgi:hypothetical protein